ncbi:MAG: ATP-binding protein [Weeksellaceae bacterium]
MDKQALKNIATDQKNAFMNKSGLIDRDTDVNNFLKTSQVVIISGVRRCGKSSLLYLIKEKLGLKENQFCYFNFDDERINTDVSIFNELYALHLEMYDTEPVFFFDEIQIIPGWQKFVNRMHEQGKKIFVTGSNAQLLSSEIATSLTGRAKILELFPFSFAEYLRFFDKNYDLNALSTSKKAALKADLTRYLEMGGFPLVIKEADLELLNGWFQDILYRDIVARYKLTSTDALRQIAVFLLTNIGKLFSYATLQQISGVKSSKSVKDFLTYFENSYLFYYLKKFDYSVKKQIMNSRKVYAIDNGVANRIGINFSKNTGRLMENAVFVELMRRKKEVYYFKGKNECDFLITENLKPFLAIQLTYELTETSFARETAGLLEAMETYKIPKGLLITFEEVHDFQIENIETVTLYEWLLKK